MSMIIRTNRDKGVKNSLIIVLTVLMSIVWGMSVLAEEQLKPPQTKEDIIKALSREEGETFEIDGKLYVWKDGLPYEVDKDGSLWLVKIPEDEGELYEVRDGRRWLSRNANGTVYLNIAPKTWATIYFDFDSDLIKPESYPVLDEFGKALSGRALSKRLLVVAGHTDNVGAEVYNKMLSEKRALSVANYLVANHGIDQDRLILQGYGMARPITTNDTDEGRAINRRVEFILLN